MSTIYYLMGKSASGKDSIYRELVNRYPFQSLVMYTTRPKRQGEEEGVQYYFTEESDYQRLLAAGKVVEARCYQTVYGPWIYYTVDDGEIHREGREDYLMIGTLESYQKIRDYYGPDLVRPLYLEVEDGIRLERALKRERAQTEPRYRELCRRYLADEEDFSEENLKKAGIVQRFSNEDMETCLKQILEFVRRIPE